MNDYMQSVLANIKGYLFLKLGWLQSEHFPWEMQKPRTHNYHLQKQPRQNIGGVFTNEMDKF